ncbi:MAG: response regulator [Desulfobacula sp.]|jgi:DNA-binding NtrC family response regulator|nr:response regulator [Desulfobacula sp.]MBT7260693.1 response regulator [Desulfobacula sp.]
MTYILLVSREKDVFKAVESVFTENKMSFEWTGTAQDAVELLAEKNIDLVITDETLPDMAGRKLVETIIVKNPMIDCVVLSALTHDKFHEAYEGLGVLMQFPLEPDKTSALKLLDHMNRIALISGRISE